MNMYIHVIFKLPHSLHFSYCFIIIIIIITVVIMVIITCDLI